MTPERWTQIEETFHLAVECEPKNRASLLDQTCKNDPELRREVEALLARAEGASDHVRAAIRSGLDSLEFPLSGQTLSHYLILDGLGSGGMGLVYRAEDIKLGRRVAIKFLPEDSAKDPAALGRFEREARSASALEHPNICPIYEFGDHAGQAFLVMQLLEGQTLRELMSATESRKPPLEVLELLDLAIQITDGLDAAHRHGIIHRDIKPANIFVTTEGHSKLLDFGLAKLAGCSTVAERDSQHDSPDGAAPPSTPDPILSRTGVAMGTAGYMSPEQIRGEELDARTDLFSFGSVLYEMATGRRAFIGDTEQVLRKAILNKMPSLVREMNPKLPERLERIIYKSLQKDRNNRYQSATEMRADMENLRNDLEPKRAVLGWGKLAAGGIALLLITSASVWFAKRQPASTRDIPEMKFRQLTASSAENAVANGAISPDGKFLAFTDDVGIHIQNTETGESQTVPKPEAFIGAEPEWQLCSWFPDSASFLLNAHPPGQDSNYWNSEGSSIWVIAVRGGPPRKLRDNAVAYSLSPDGSKIAFGTNKGRLGDREIWLMGPNGEHSLKFDGTDEHSSISGLIWSNDARRVIYEKINESENTLLSRDVVHGPPTQLLSPAETARLKAYVWLPDGRLVYSLVEEESFYGEGACNLWQMQLDVASGKPVGKSRRLTNWPQFCLDNLSVTADAKELVVRKSAFRITTYLADLQSNGTRIGNTKHFTLSESWDLPEDWTGDSKAILLLSNRTGKYGVYKQFLNGNNEKLLVPGTAGLVHPRVSADGKWVLYERKINPSDASSRLEVLRLPIEGGSAEVIATVRPGGSLLRARAPSSLCAVAEPSTDRKRLVITALDPIKGRGDELAQFALDPNTDFWDAELSPDGTEIAALRSPKGPIYILSLRGKLPREIHVKDWNSFASMDWAADGEGLFMSNGIQHGAVILHVDLDGKAQILWTNHGGMYAPGLPSPDGRQLAILASPWESNLWMIENF